MCLGLRRSPLSVDYLWIICDSTGFLACSLSQTFSSQLVPILSSRAVQSSPTSPDLSSHILLAVPSKYVQNQFISTLPPASCFLCCPGLFSTQQPEGYFVKETNRLKYF